MEFDDEITPPSELVQTWLTRAGKTPLHLTMSWDREVVEEKRKAVFDLLIYVAGSASSYCPVLPQLEILPP